MVAISCALFCLVFTVLNAERVDENLLQRFENFEAKHESEIASLKKGIVENEKDCASKLSAMEQRIWSLEHKNDKLEAENRRSKEEIDSLTKKIEEIAVKEDNKLPDVINTRKWDVSQVVRKGAKGMSPLHKRAPHEHPKNSPRDRRALNDELQIAFTAYLDHNVDHIGANQVLICNTMLLNDGQGYNNFTGVFTAPTTGVYSFSFFIGQRHVNEYRAWLVVNGKNQIDAAVDPMHLTQDLQGGNTANLRLVKGDAVYITHQGGGTHVEGNDGMRSTSFSGFLIYPLEMPDIVGK